jgi:hypothetical protein
MTRVPRCAATATKSDAPAEQSSTRPDKSVGLIANIATYSSYDLDVTSTRARYPAATGALLG